MCSVTSRWTPSGTTLARRLPSTSPGWGSIQCSSSRPPWSVCSVSSMVSTRLSTLPLSSRPVTQGTCETAHSSYSICALYVIKSAPTTYCLVSVRPKFSAEKNCIVIEKHFIVIGVDCIEKPPRTRRGTIKNDCFLHSQTRAYTPVCQRSSTTRRHCSSRCLCLCGPPFTLSSGSDTRKHSPTSGTPRAVNAMNR